MLTPCIAHCDGFSAENPSQFAIFSPRRKSLPTFSATGHTPNVSTNAKMTNSTDTYFEIIDGSDFIKVEVLKQNFPQAELDWDKNSVSCWISAKFGMFSGKFKADLMTFNFQVFKNQLEILYENLDQSATFEGYEDQVTIKIKGDGIGHLNVFCYLTDYVGIGNELKGEINFDQTGLPKLIGQLEKITSEHKVYGQIK